MRAVWLTLACNNACAFCPQQEARTSPGGGFFSSEAIQDRLREAARLDKTVALVGGEPTLHPELFAFARLAREAGAEALVVQTNGRRLAYSSYARGLVEAGVTAVDISLHGTTAVMHEFHTRTAGSFAQTLTGIGVARGAGLRVGVTCVLTRSNYRHAPELVRLAAARGARAVQFAPAQQLPGGATLAPSLRPPAEMARPYLGEASRVARALGVELLQEGSTSPALGGLFAGVGQATPKLRGKRARRASLPPAARSGSGRGGGCGDLARIRFASARGGSRPSGAGRGPPGQRSGPRSRRSGPRGSCGRAPPGSGRRPRRRAG